MERDDHVKLGLSSWEGGPLAAAEAVHPQVPRKGRPLPSSRSPSQWWAGDLGAREEKCFVRPAGRKPRQEGKGATHAGWQALLYPLCTLGPPPNCLKTLDLVTSVLPRDTCRLDMAPWPTGECGCSKESLGEQAGAKAQLTPAL